MSFHQTFKNLAAALLVLTITASAQAQLKLPSFGKRNRAPAQTQQRQIPVELTDRCGPWLVMCASFVGEDAEIQAMELVRELRNQHRLRAYIYRHHFDFSGNFEGVGYDPNEGQRLSNGNLAAKPPKMRALRDSSFDEIAVLVGDFPTIEDARAQQTLQKIKYMMPESLGKLAFGVDEQGEYLVRPKQADTQRMRVWRSVNKTVNANADKRKGPMGAAFMLTNPMLPDEYFTAHRVDDFVLKLNRRFRHSLLENPGMYAVRVATFRGDSTFELDQMQQEKTQFNWRLQQGKSIKESKLALALAKAHRLTLELRKLGIAAYEFHDRHESYVCVGSFDWLKQQRSDGQEVQNPQIVQTIQAFKGQIENFPGVQGAVRPKSLQDIVRTYGIKADKIPNLHKMGVVFDVQPIPVRIPNSQAQTHTANRQGQSGNRRFR